MCLRNGSSGPRTKSSVAEHDAAEAAALAVDVLGRGVDHDVGAELEQRWKIGVANTLSTITSRAGRVRELGDRGDVDHLERRVAGDSRKTSRVGRSAAAHCVEVGAVDEA